MPVILSLVMLLAPIAVSAGELRSGGLIQGGVVSVPAGELFPVGILYDVASGGKAGFRLEKAPKDVPWRDLPVKDHLRYRHDLYVSVDDLRALAEVQDYPARRFVVIKTEQGWIAFRYGEQASVLRTYAAKLVIGDLVNCEFHQRGNACSGASLPIEFSGLDEAVTAQFHPCKACFPGGCPPFDQYQQALAKREAAFKKTMIDNDGEIRASKRIAWGTRAVALSSVTDSWHNLERNWFIVHRGFSIPLGSTG